VIATGGLFPPGTDLDLSVSEETRRRIAGWPAAAATGVVTAPRSVGVMVALVALGALALAGAVWVARSD
jgi:hypothetical protein